MTGFDRKLNKYALDLALSGSSEVYLIVPIHITHTLFQAQVVALAPAAPNSTRSYSFSPLQEHSEETTC